MFTLIFGCFNISSTIIPDPLNAATQRGASPNSFKWFGSSPRVANSFTMSVYHLLSSFSLSMVCMGGWKTGLYSRGPLALFVGAGEPKPQSPKHPTTLILLPPVIRLPNWWLWKHFTEPVASCWYGTELESAKEEHRPLSCLRSKMSLRVCSFRFTTNSVLE